MEVMTPTLFNKQFESNNNQEASESKSMVYGTIVARNKQPATTQTRDKSRNPQS